MQVVDPVCRVELASEDTKFISEYQGRTFYFDSEECLREFESNPEVFSGAIREKVYDEHMDRLDGSE